MPELKPKTNMATINNSNTSHERRRRSAPAIATLRLTDLPDALLASVASYLPHTSCAALVMAMTSSPDSMLSHRPSATCRAVVSQVDWSTLDIGDVEQSCDLRLADGHLRWFLTCIDAASRVKSLKLTHCFHITGAGLKPLRGTKVLKEIDLSLVGIHESPDIEPLPAISEGVVLPILDIISLSLRATHFHSCISQRNGERREVKCSIIFWGDTRSW